MHACMYLVHLGLDDDAVGPVEPPARGNVLHRRRQVRYQLGLLLLTEGEERVRERAKVAGSARGRPTGGAPPPQPCLLLPCQIM